MELQINKDTQLCMSLAARPGNFGTRFHNFLYRELGLNFIYKAFTTRDLAAAIGGIAPLEFADAPFRCHLRKHASNTWTNWTASAKGIMSVNTVVNTDGYLKAYNTDYTAVSGHPSWVASRPEVDFALRGSGGMAKAVACALKDAGFTNGLIVARNEAAGTSLARQYGFQWKKELTGETPGLLINVTPVGDGGWCRGGSACFFGGVGSLRSNSCLTSSHSPRKHR